MADMHFSPRPNRAHEIHWHDWGPESFRLAREQDKPVLLAISAVWCHWCHVMDETTYSDPEVIRLVNENYIPVRVDNDERPDVNRRYNMGGWPTTAFLTPDGELLTGGTYLPPEQMLNYLTQVGDVYRNSKEEILKKVAEVSGRRAEALKPRAAPAQLAAEIVSQVKSAIIATFDPVHGGFGDEPKFPQSDVLEFLLERYYETRDSSLLRMVTLTLDHMASGGLYDQAWGGFFRYSTTRDWSIPHYEKMLEDNAKLLSVYVHAYQVTGEELYLKTIRSLTAYVDLTLSNPEQGGFYGSQDADETFYTLPIEQRTRVPAPYVDRTFYTDWNALMVSAYLAAAHVLPPGAAGEGLEGERLQAFALKTLDRLWNEMYRPGQGLYHYAKEGGTPQVTGLLSDLSHSIAAFLDAYQATGDNLYIQRAEILVGVVQATLYDDATHTFWSEVPDQQSPGLLRVPERPINENAVMADALIRFYRLTGVDKYRAVAEPALAYFGSDYARYGEMAAEYARAVDHMLHEPVSVHIVGGVDDPRTRDLQAAALKEFAPEKVVQVLDPVRDNTRLTQLGYPHDSNPLAYVCVGQKCLAPVSDAKSVASEMQEIRG